jgi:hypothetical protein
MNKVARSVVQGDMSCHSLAEYMVLLLVTLHAAVEAAVNVQLP